MEEQHMNHNAIKPEAYRSKELIEALERELDELGRKLEEIRARRSTLRRRLYAELSPFAVGMRIKFKCNTVRRSGTVTSILFAARDPSTCRVGPAASTWK